MTIAAIVFKYMKEKKRIFLSLSRKKSNLLLVGILFFLISFMMMFLSIYGTSKQTMKEVEKKYGTSFMLLLYRDKSKPELWEEREVEGVGTLNYYIGPGIDEEMMDYILEEVEGVTDYEGGREYEVILCDYELIPGYWKYMYEDDLIHPDPNGMNPVEEIENLRFLTQCQALRKSEHFKEFQNGNFKLIEGRHIEPEDKHVVLVSEEFAERNNLQIGDTFKIQASSLTLGTGLPALPLGLIETKIVGIYETTYTQVVTEYTNECDILNNWILVDNETGYDLDKIYGDSPSLWVSTIYVENPAELDKVMKEVNSLEGIDWQYYELREDDSMYKDAVKPLDTVRKIMFVCLCVILAASILLLSLVITHSMKKRVRETGILMSLGITGKEIRRQFLLEHLLIGITAFLLAFAVSFAVTPVIGEQIYGAVHQEKEQQVYTEKEIEAAIARGEQSKASEMAKNQKTGVEPPEELNTRIDIRTVLIVFIVMILIIYFCVNAVIKKTLKLEPIRVLSMIE